MLIFDHPTRGIDVRCKAQIYDLMDKLTNQGYAILLITTETPEVVNLSDRIYILQKGRIVKEFDNKDMINQEEVIYFVTSSSS